MTAATDQNATVLLLRIFLARLAVDAIPGVRQRVEPLERDVVPALVAFAEGLGRAVQPAECLVDVPEESSFLARHQERFLASFDWPFGSAVAVIYLVFTGVAFASLIAVRKLVERQVR